MQHTKLGRWTAVALAGSAVLWPVAAQAAIDCNLILNYEVWTPSVIPVPSLVTWSVGALSLGLAVLAWRSRKTLQRDVRHGIGALLLGGAVVGVWHVGISPALAVLPNLTDPVDITSPIGPYIDNFSGNDSDADALPFPSPLVMRNMTGQRLRILSNNNQAPSDTCVPGAVIEPGSSCTASLRCNQYL